MIEEGTVGTELYMIADGEVQVSKDDQRLGYLGTGAFFGEYPVLQVLNGVGGNGSTLRIRTVQAIRNSDLAFLRLEDILEVLAKFPELRIRINALQRAGASVSKYNAQFKKATGVNIYAKQPSVAQEGMGDATAVGTAIGKEAATTNASVGATAEKLEATVQKLSHDMAKVMDVQEQMLSALHDIAKVKVCCESEVGVGYAPQSKVLATEPEPANLPEDVPLGKTTKP